MDAVNLTPQQPPQPEHLPLVDPGNPMIQPGNSSMITGITTNRNTALITIREGNTTLTVFLNKESLGKWIADLTTTRAQMTDLIVPNGAVNLSKLSEQVSEAIKQQKGPA